MKKQLIALIITVGSFSALAQNAELKEKKSTLNPDAVLIYHVSSNQIKNGPFYIKKPNNDQVLLKGAYTDNKRCGNWYFYDDKGQLETCYSYQQDKLAFIDSTLLSKIAINIPGQTDEVAANSTIPVLLSPMNLFLAQITKELQIPQEHFQDGKPLPIDVISEIDETGAPKYSVSYKYQDKAIKHDVKLKNSNTFNIEWIPASYNKKPIKSQLVVSTAIQSPSDSEDGHQRFKWGY